MELRNSIAQHFEADLPATIMFDHPTVAALAAYLAASLAPAGLRRSARTTAEGELHYVQPRGSSRHHRAQVQVQVTELVAVSGRYPEPPTAPEGGVCVVLEQGARRPC